MNAVAQLDLTEMQAAYVAHVVSGIEPAKAATLAGYANDGSIVASELMRNPRILAAIHYETARRIGALAPVAVSVLETIANDDTAPKGVRVDAAKTLLDRAGHLPPKAASEGGSGRTPAGMSTEELRALADELQRTIEARAKPVQSLEEMLA